MATTPAPQLENPLPPPAAPPSVTDRSSKPKGVIPKSIQSWVGLAVLGLIAVGIFFSGTPKKATKSSAANQAEIAPATSGGLTPEQVQKRLQESEDLARRTGDPAQLPGGQQPQPGDPRYNPDAAFVAANTPPANTPPDPIAEDERKRDYIGRYASNVALSYRNDPRAPRTPASVLNSALAPDQFAAGASDLPANIQQQLEALQSQQGQLLAASQQQLAAATGAASGQPSNAPAASSVQNRKTTNDNNSSGGKKHIIFEGTLLESVLVNRLNGDFAGPVICQTTTDLYSHDHSTLLIPAGTRILGETKKVDSTGQTRLAVIFHRLIMPDGYAVELDLAPALNQIGETALKDQVNNHYFQIFGASIAVGAIAGLSTIGTNNSAVTGSPVSTADAYRQGVASSLSQSSLHILDRFLNILPTITIREGHRVRVFLTQDLEVPAYVNHTMPPNL